MQLILAARIRKRRKQGHVWGEGTKSYWDKQIFEAYPK